MLPEKVTFDTVVPTRGPGGWGRVGYGYLPATGTAIPEPLPVSAGS